MDVQSIIDSLEFNEGVFRYILAPDSPLDVHWKPYPEHWNLLEITCHLLDEEVYDFRSRTEHVLEYPEMPMPAIVPALWVTRHHYAERDYMTVLNDFIRERNKSTEWLNALKNPQWENTYQHPKLGGLTARYFLTNWLAHDYLHIRQANRLRYLYLRDVAGVDLNFAGDYGQGL